VMPRMYGYKSVKWVERIELQAEAERGYWEQHGYDSNAWIGKLPSCGSSTGNSRSGWHCLTTSI